MTQTQIDSKTVATNLNITVEGKNGDNELVAMDTGKDGDCGFHAACGDWIGHQFVCQDVEAKKLLVEQQLLSCSNDSKVAEYAKKAIAGNILAELDMRGQHLAHIADLYHKYYAENKDEEQKAWGIFEKELRKAEPILECINSDAKTDADTLKKNFKQALFYSDPDGIKARIFSLVYLQRAFENWDRIIRLGFDFEQHLNNNKDVISEYANFIKTPRQYLAPHDLAVIAITLSITIHFYTTNSHTGAMSEPEIYNPNQSNSVDIIFDGVNHFRRMVTRAERTRLLQQSQEQFDWRFFAEHSGDKKDEKKSESKQSSASIQSDSKFGNVEDEIENDLLKCLDCNKFLDDPDSIFELPTENDGNPNPRYHHAPCLQPFIEEKKPYISKLLKREVKLPYEMRKIGIKTEEGLKKAAEKYGYAFAQMKQQEQERLILLSALTKLQDFKELYRRNNSGVKVIKADIVAIYGARNYLKRGNGVVLLGNNTVSSINSSFSRAAISGLKNGTTTGLAVATVKTLKSAKTAVSLLRNASTTVRSLTLSSIKSFAAGPAVAGVGMGLAVFALDWYSSNRANKFCNLIRAAQEQFEARGEEKEKYEQALATIKEAFNAYWWTRLSRWFSLSWDDFAYAHYLEACAHLNLKHYDLAYQQFLASYNDAASSEIRFFCTLQMIKLLGDYEKLPQLKETSESNNLNNDERNNCHKKRLSELGTVEYKNIAERYYEIADGLFGDIIAILNAHPKKFSKEIYSYLSENEDKILKFLKCDELFLIRHFYQRNEDGTPNYAGKVHEVLLTYLQGLLFSLYSNYGCSEQEAQLLDLVGRQTKNSSGTIISSLHKNKSTSLFDLATNRFIQTWNLIAEHGFSEGLSVENLNDPVLGMMLTIKDFITEYFLSGIKKSLFCFDAYQKMIEIGLVPAENAIIPEAQLRLMYAEAQGLADFEDAKHLDMGEILNGMILGTTDSNIMTDDGNNLLHLLPRIDPKLKFASKIQSLAQKLIEDGVSPYDRNIYGCTAFRCIPDNDPYGMKQLYTPPELFGVEKQIAAIKLFFNSVAANSSLAQHFLLLAGPPGTGKTELVKLLSKECKYECIEYKSSSDSDMFPNAIERRIEVTFQTAKELNKCVCVFMDEIDRTFKTVKGPTMEGCISWASIVRTLQKELDNLRGTKVVLVGATNHLAELDKAVVNRAGTPVMFDLPDPATRLKIIEHQLRMYRISDDGLPIRLAANTHDFSPRMINLVLTSIINKAKAAGHPYHLNSRDFETEIKACGEAKQLDLAQVLPGVTVELPKLILAESSDPYKECVGLKNEVKQQADKVIRFLRNPEIFRSSMKDYETHTLLYGPPGTGKTSIARVIAEATGSLFILINPSQYKVKGAELVLQQAFTYAKRFEKAVIFIDEIDTIANKNKSSLATARTLQLEMDGFKKHHGALVVIGATNVLKDMQDALISRFSEKVEVALPDKEQRALLFKFYLDEIALSERIKFDFTKTMSEAILTLAEASTELSARDIKKNIIYSATSDALNSETNSHNPIVTLNSLLGKIRNLKRQNRSTVSEDTEQQIHHTECKI